MSEHTEEVTRVKMTLSIGFSGADHTEIIEIPNEEFDDCSSVEERDAIIESHWTYWTSNYIDGGFEVLGE